MGVLAKAARFSAEDWRDVGRAIFELAWARVRLGITTAEDLLAAAPTSVQAPTSGERADALIDRVATAIGRASARVPWRSDCLVQALAAQRWLGEEGVASELFVGVRLVDEQGVDAHAWLVSNGVIVTGGDVSGFTPLVTPEVLAALGSR